MPASGPGHMLISSMLVMRFFCINYPNTPIIMTCYPKIPTCIFIHIIIHYLTVTVGCGSGTPRERSWSMSVDIYAAGYTEKSRYKQIRYKHISVRGISSTAPHSRSYFGYKNILIFHLVIIHTYAYNERAYVCILSNISA